MPANEHLTVVFGMDMLLQRAGLQRLVYGPIGWMRFGGVSSMVEPAQSAAA